MQSARDKDIARAREEFGVHYDSLGFVSEARARQAEEQRRQLLGELGRAGIGVAGNGAKLYTNRLSPGCRTCGQGTWSCLFINGICNGRCFYCPTPQDAEGVPSTNTLTFRQPDDYLDYLATFGFTGASISGGEPLLTFDRTLAYLRAVKQRFGDAIHLWMYTNGLLLTQEKLGRLKAAGLDELRFDISADGYNLEKVGMAVGVIDTVTVEIPAIPEDFARLQTVVVELDRLGVGFLNLHQLRCTPHNRVKLVGRPYTYLHGPRVAVLESELAVLQLLAFVLAQGLRLGINYCSYIYKHRYQAAGSRRRSAEVLCKPYETITDAGLIRCLAVRGAGDDLERLARQLTAEGIAAATWEWNKGKQCLFLASAPAAGFDWRDLQPVVSYQAAALRENVSYRNVFRQVTLPGGKKLFAERWPVSAEIPLTPEQAVALWPPSPTTGGVVPSGVAAYEQIPEGLWPYF